MRYKVAHRLMHIQKVNVVQLKPSQHLVYRLQCLSFPVFRRPEFAGDPYFLARDSASLNRAPDPGLVIVGVCGVDVTVAGLQRREARLLAHRVRRLEECPRAELRHQYSIVELYHRYVCRSPMDVLRSG